MTRGGLWLLLGSLAASGLVATWPIAVAGARGASRARQALRGDVLWLQSPPPSMLLVRASSFEMGSTPIEVVEAMLECSRSLPGHRCRESAFADEIPTRRVEVSAYWLDSTEVTVASYERCVQARRCRPIPFDGGARRFDEPSFPVSLVTWGEAVRYCRFQGARLPTEAEWERAARGPRGRRYPWGNQYASRASNHGRLGWARTDARDGYRELAPVGAYPSGRTPEGFLDLAGNVSEWTADYYSGYSEGPARNPQQTKPGANAGRVVRGGDFASAAVWLRGAARREADPSVRLPTLGFRCARSAPE